MKYICEECGANCDAGDSRNRICDVRRKGSEANHAMWPAQMIKAIFVHTDLFKTEEASHESM